MKGNNTIIFNHATMQAAVEYYLNNMVFKSPIRVVKVFENNDNGFDVSVEELDTSGLMELRDTMKAVVDGEIHG